MGPFPFLKKMFYSIVVAPEEGERERDQCQLFDVNYFSILLSSMSRSSNRG